MRMRSAALVVALAACGCESRSSRVDGADLQGVFDRDAGPSDAGPVAPASATPTASASSAPAPRAPRAPEADGCVEVSGQPRTELTRTLGRPACRGAEVMEWRDGLGAPRYGCLFSAPGEARGPLPLVVFFPGDGPTLDNPTAVHKHTGLRGLQGKTAMSGDGPAGFHVLAIQGRALTGASSATFDTGYTGADNVDRLTTDHFVDELLARKLVDPRRIYAVGLGPGGAMASTWAMVRADRVAAFAVFAAPPPTASWTCPGPPPPALVLYRACDAIVACDEVEGWLSRREAARGETLALRLGDDVKEALNCDPRNACGEKRGTAGHSRWPKGLERRILGFLAGHSLDLAPRPTLE